MKNRLIFFSVFVVFLISLGIVTNAQFTSRTLTVEGNSVDTLNARTIVVGGIPFSYADMHFSDELETIPMVQGVYSHITNATNTLFNSDISRNATFQGDSIIIDKSGIFRLSVHLSFIGAQNDVYEAAVSINDVIDNDHKFTRKTSSNDVGDASFHGLYEFEKGDGVKIEIKNTANNKDAIMVNGCLTLNRID